MPLPEGCTEQDVNDAAPPELEAIECSQCGDIFEVDPGEERLKSSYLDMCGPCDDGMWRDE